jgi:hypothetical protein
MLIVDRCASHLLLFVQRWSRPPHVAAASHRTRGKSERQARATEGQRTAARDGCNESLVLRFMRAKKGNSEIRRRREARAMLIRNRNPRSAL